MQSTKRHNSSLSFSFVPPSSVRRGYPAIKAFTKMSGLADDSRETRGDRRRDWAGETHLALSYGSRRRIAWGEEVRADFGMRMSRLRKS